MFPNLRFMVVAVLTSLVMLVIVSGALVSTRRDVPVVLHPVGSRPLVASWQNDDMQGFEARFGPQAMLINASVQLPPVDNVAPARSNGRIDFIADANAANDPVKLAEPTPHAETGAAASDAAKTSYASVPPPAEPLNITPVTLPAAERLAAVSAVDVPKSDPLPDTKSDATPDVKIDAQVEAKVDVKSDPSGAVAAVEAAAMAMPVPAKDPQVASDAPAQPSRRVAAVMPAAPAVAGPAFSDTSRTERIVKPAVKRRAQIKRPKRRIVRAPAIRQPAKPAPANPFATLFGPNTNTPSRPNTP